MNLTQTPYGSFFYFPRCIIGCEIAQGHFWDPHFRPYFDALAEGSVVVDVGANIGWFTIYAAKRGCEVWAFECSPEVFDLLQKNAELNEVLAKVHLENVALWDSPVELTLLPEWCDWPQRWDGRVDYEAYRNSGTMSLTPGKGNLYKFVSRTLDSYNLSKCDLLKTDVQGADFRVLMGARETIRKFRPVVCFELEPVPAALHGDCLDSFSKFFAELHYSAMTCVYEGGPDTNGYKDFVVIP